MVADLSQSANALPVIPLTLQESSPYKRQYEKAVKSIGLDERIGAAALSVVRLSVEHRRTMAREEREGMFASPKQMEEYAQLFAQLDSDKDTAVRDRIRAFTAARYLPSYELYAELALRNEPDALSTELAMKAFALLLEATEGVATVVNDEPEAHVKVDRLMPHSHPYSFAVVSTKVDGVAVEKEGHLLQIKTRRQGLVDMNEVEEEGIKNALKVIARTQELQGVASEQLHPFRTTVERYVAEGHNYLPVIDRVYMTRTDLTELSDVFPIVSDRSDA